MVLADGSLAICSLQRHPELFAAIPNSYGTLGFLTAVEIDIIPFKPYIKMKYYHVSSTHQAQEVLKRVCQNPKVDSVEGILFSMEHGLIMTGEFTDSFSESTDGKMNRIGKWYLTFSVWFWLLPISFDIMVSGTSHGSILTLKK